MAAAGKGCAGLSHAGERKGEQVLEEEGDHVSTCPGPTPRELTQHRHLFMRVGSGPKRLSKIHLSTVFLWAPDFIRSSGS